MNENYIHLPTRKLAQWEGLLGMKFDWLKLKGLGLPHLHVEAVQEVEPVISAKGDLTFLR